MEEMTEIRYSCIFLCKQRSMVGRDKHRHVNCEIELFMKGRSISIELKKGSRNSILHLILLLESTIAIIDMITGNGKV